MSESTKTVPVVKYLRDHGVMTFKHADGFTTGVPDVSATDWGHTTWLEMKDLKPNETFLERVNKDKLQFQNMKYLEKQGRAYYVFFYKKSMFIVLPSRIMDERPPDDPSVGFRSNEYSMLLHLVRRKCHVNN